MTQKKKKYRKRINPLYILVPAVVIFTVLLIAGKCFGDAFERFNTSAEELYRRFCCKVGLMEPGIYEDGLTVRFLDVGQGDCALVICGGEAMLIDGGTDLCEPMIIDTVRQYGITELKAVIATHPHSDHIGALDEALRVFSPPILLMPEVLPGADTDENEYHSLLLAASEAGTEVLTVGAGFAYSVGEASLKILAPSKPDSSLNDSSLIIRLDYGESSFLFAGDAGKAEEELLLKSGANIDCDVLKVGHHGSSGASGMEFLAAVTPETAVISCGIDNSYGHPAMETLKRLKTFTDSVYRTDYCGNIIVRSDGHDITVTSEK